MVIRTAIIVLLEPAAVVVRVHDLREILAADVVHARNPAGLVLGLRQRRQEHSGQDRDDRDHDQQLDERESVGTLS